METLLHTLQVINNYMKERDICGELLYRGEKSHLLRVANDQVSLNVTEEGGKFFVTLQDNKRFARGSIATSAENITHIKGLIDDLHESIRFFPEVPFSTPMKPICQHTPYTAHCDPEIENMESSIMRGLYEKAIEYYAPRGLTTSGSFSAGMYEYALINTLVEMPLYYKGTDFNTEVVLQLMEGKKEVRIDSCGARLSQNDPDRLLKDLERSVHCMVSTECTEIKPGKYDVIFGINAIAELISFLSWLGFDGETYEYEMGMLQKSIHKMGDRILGENFTLIDDPEDPDILYAHPFGINGVERKGIRIFDKGRICYLYYSDKLSADRFGHAVNNDISTANLKLLGGEGPASFNEMVSHCAAQTIYIPYLHYMHSPNRAAGEITATTRFGTFLLEDGKVKKHFINFRLHDTLFNIFSNIEWLSSTLSAVNLADTYDLRFAKSLTAPLYMRVKGVSLSN
ncbi:MAG: metallopeptidase TldD-related protein [bacterium]